MISVKAPTISQYLLIYDPAWYINEAVYPCFYSFVFPAYPCIYLMPFWIPSSWLDVMLWLRVVLRPCLWLLAWQGKAGEASKGCLWVLFLVSLTFL
ncbi:hypothetical protein BDV59DRAFT_95207 [Aspergillus ambiguus]|uniref:uncharacterized protein n=1 Tax=Aspergillus ambiguus TaxID=176160 RepID=UPI003CCD00A1